MNKRLISTEIASFIQYGSVKDVVKLISDAGFEAYDFSMHDETVANEYLYADDYLQKARDLRKYADQIGILCNQSHALFPTVIVGDEGYNQKAFEGVIRCLEISEILGAKICIVHPCNHYNAEQNKEFYMRLLPYAQKHGVKIALENMFNRSKEDNRIIDAACSHHDDFKRHLDMLPADHFVACVDIGHAFLDGLRTSSGDMIRALGDRVCSLHIHDNDARSDRHSLPFTMDIDFNEMIDALADINYRGDITFEAAYFTPRFPTNVYPEIARLMYAIGVYFRDELEKKISMRS